MRVEIDGRSQGKTKKISGEPRDETVVHVVSNKDELIKNMSRDEPKARDKKGAPAVPLNGSDGSAEALLVKPKLPKMILPRFTGEITEFRGFWDRFETAVHNNPSLSTVDKFTYLHALLEGTAARSIQGLALTEANYKAATQILKSRFGNTQQVISAHMEDLLKLPACHGDKTSQLRLVYDKIWVNVRGLEALGVDADQYGSFLIPIIMAKLPADVRLQVARITNKDVWKIEELLKIIKGEVEAREISDAMKTNERRSAEATPRGTNLGTASSLVTGDQGSGKKTHCVYCGEDHYSVSCKGVTEISGRRDILKKEGRCFVCLAKGHRAAQCRCTKKCRKCGRRHHQSICEQTQESEKRQLSQSSDNTNTNLTNNALASTTRNKKVVLLQTARTYAHATDGEMVPVRVLFDNGSQRSYLTNSLKTRLGLKPLKKEVVNLNVFGNDSFRRQNCDLVKVKLQGKSNEGIEIVALGFHTICSPLPRAINLHQYPYLQHLDLADCQATSHNSEQCESTIDILIGSDFYWDLVLGEINRQEGGLVAMRSKFGWLLSGPVKNSSDISEVTHSNLVVQVPSTVPASLDNECSLEKELRRFWDIESLGIMNDTEPNTGVENFPSQISYDFLQGHYKVGLPWKLSKPESTNYGLCVKRLNQLKSRLLREPSLLTEYENTFKKQLEEGIIERIPRSELDSKQCHFLPHHGVIREDKDTTKLRIVFDGSAKSNSRSYSLNDCLEKGPNLTPLIFDVLLKFRTHKIGITSDIEKAFHQIIINPEDRDMLRMLWYENINSTPKEIVQYRFCRLVFGLTPSPAILRGVIRHHLLQYRGSHTQVAQFLLDTLYVDDLPGGATDDKNGFEFYQQAKEIMKIGGFNLRKWRSNSHTLQQQISEAEGEAVSEVPRVVRVLGLNWDTQEDCLVYKLDDLISYINALPPTKRSLLRISAKIFDPLGFISPVTIAAKMLFQQVCAHKSDWDQPLEDDALSKWNQLPKAFEALSQLKIPRCYSTQEIPNASLELHGFSDASEKAYAAVVYLRTTARSEGNIEVCLVASKTRVTPMKKQSIPRLELLGALLLARLLNNIKGTLKPTMGEIKSYCWVDSYTTLCWIKNDRCWKQYIQGRVNEIRRLTSRDTWRHCPGKENPADIPSRSCGALELVASTLWWNGPGFLQHDLEQWPDLVTNYEVEGANEELIKNTPMVIHSLINTSGQDDTKTINLDQIISVKCFSTRLKLLRVTALVLKFKELLRTPEKISDRRVTAEDISMAERLWTKTIQLQSFPNECQDLAKNKKEVSLKQLILYRDNEGVLRCKGRLGAASVPASVPASANDPILLPPKHPYTVMLILEHHKLVHHNGIRETLNSIRQIYWIIRGREAVKQVVRKCVLCLRYEGRAYSSPVVPALPEERVSGGPPFLHTGVDFAGPLYVSLNNQQQKVYVCLFTCASTRGIHLELTADLSTVSFLQAFRRFTSRRGLPATILSDNAKTFKSASSDVKNIVRSSEVQIYMVNHQVKWKFIVEKAPWWGGFWERMVGITKRCLRKTIGRSKLTFEELRTVIVEIEGTVNNRPLTYLYDDMEGISQALTPARMMYGHQIINSPSERHFEITDIGRSLTKRARHQFRVLNEFVKQWRREYLLGLREHTMGSVRRLNQRGERKIKTGDIVVLKEDCTQRSWWKLARVMELEKGRDGLVRAARVQVLSQDKKAATFRRPIQQLIPLEVSENQ